MAIDKWVIDLEIKTGHAFTKAQLQRIYKEAKLSKKSVVQKPK